jgi:NADPH:quinone reductase-like Zn-dependent oxidoreductase
MANINVVVREYGSSEHPAAGLAVEEAPIPEIGPDEVLLRLTHRPIDPGMPRSIERCQGFAPELG